MRDEAAATEAAREYAAAHAAHDFERRDLPRALVEGVVPKQELLDAQLELARARPGHRFP